MGLISHEVGRDADPERLAHQVSSQPRLICIRRTSAQRGQVCLFAPPLSGRGNSPYFDDQTDCQRARTTSQSVPQPSCATSDMRVVPGHRDDRLVLFLRRPPGPGDAISVRLLNEREGPGSSGIGPIVITEDKKQGALGCAHAFAGTELFGRDNGPSDFAYHPCREFGAERDPARHRIGRAHVLPLRDDVRQGMDTGLITFDDGIERPNASVVPLLWAGYFRFGHSVSGSIREQVVRVQPPRERITEEWLKAQLACLREGAAFQMTPYTPSVRLSEMLTLSLEIHVRARSDKAFVSVFANFGIIAGPGTVSESSLDSTVYMCGPRSGITEGRIWGVKAHVDGLRYGPNLGPAAFRDWFIVEGFAANPFSRPGDSNSSVYFKEGHQLRVCGIVAGGVVIQENERARLLTLVQPIQPCLDYWRARLFTGT